MMMTSAAATGAAKGHVQNGARLIAPAELGNAELRELWRYWLTRQPAGRLPAYGDMDPIRFPRLLPRSFVIRVGRDPLSFTYTLVGETNIEAHGANFKGQDVRELDKRWPGYGASLHEFYTLVTGTADAMAACGTMDFLDRGFCQFEAVYLPLADEQGNVSRILGAAHYTF
ncbi:MAG: PAS domain-containing protein [Parvibaculaceae bacterium]|nr:PAS domain-containing protein [Parvibaculaceae bacterium]